MSSIEARTDELASEASALAEATAPTIAKAVAQAIREAGIQVSAAHPDEKPELAGEFERLSQSVAREDPDSLVRTLRSAAATNPGGLIAWLVASADGSATADPAPPADEPVATASAHGPQVGPGGLGYLMTLEKSDEAEIDWGNKDLA